MTLDSLRRSGRQIPVPFSLRLPDGTALLCESLLRVMPGKRLVVSARLGQQRVLAKLFFAGKSFATECTGYPLLHATGVPTPALLATHTLDQGGVCLYDLISDATPLDTLWPTLDLPGKQQQMQTLLALLARCYQAGIYQDDLHLGNFLFSQDCLYALDPASCQSFASTATRHDNLALLLAQMPLHDWPWIAQQIVSAFPDMDDGHLHATADALWQRRKKQYLEKIARDCTDVADLSHGNRHILCHRHYLSPAMHAALDDPARLLAHGQLLKAGNSATVFAADIDGKRYVLKRYRNKDLWRTLRRLWRTSRAARCWYFSHALAFAGIDTPRAVALVEVRKHGAIAEAWFITEAVEGKDLLTLWQQQSPDAQALACIHNLFGLLKKTGIEHGDMKATNILAADGKYYLIDLDGAREVSGKKARDKAHRHDVERFLRNWDNPAVRTPLAAVLAS